jgi:hypothetical protein
MPMSIKLKLWLCELGKGGDIRMVKKHFTIFFKAYNATDGGTHNNVG